MNLAVQNENYFDTITGGRSSAEYIRHLQEMLLMMHFIECRE
jgi:hypothetical protein